MSIFHEIRCAVRALAKQPGFTLAAVVTLALGIGANVAIFAVVNGMLLEPLPYGNQARVLSIDERSPRFPDGMSVPLADFFDWRERQQVFEAMAVFQESSFTLTGVDEPERINGTVTSTDLLSSILPPDNGQLACLACPLATSWWLALVAYLAGSALYFDRQFSQQK